MTAIGGILGAITGVFWAVICFLQTYNGLVTAIATVAIGGFTWALARVSRTQSNLTRDSIKLTRDMFAADQRPWLSLESPEIFISLDRESALIWFDVRNAGKSVATHVELRASIAPVNFPDIFRKRGGDFCIALTAHSNRPEWQYIISPNESVTISNGDDLYIENPSSGNFFELNYCVTYAASGIDRPLRKGGQVTFSDGSISEPDDDGWCKVTPREHDFRVTYAD